MPNASVVVIAHNEEKNIKACLDALSKQSTNDFEIIAVDDGSTDRTSQILKQFSNIRVVANKTKKGYSTARNKGIEASSGKFVFFTDADCIPDKHWIKNGLRCISNSGKSIAGVYGRTDFEKIDNMTSGPWFKSCPVQQSFPYPGTLNCAYRKEVLEKTGLFDEKYNIGGEDRELALRLHMQGYRFLRCEDMIVFHAKKKLTIKRGMSLCRRKINNVYLVKKYGKKNEWIQRLCWNSIIAPEYLASILFPPYFVWKQYKDKRFRGIADIPMLFVVYAGLVYGRLLLWKAAFKERIFLL